MNRIQTNIATFLFREIDAVSIAGKILNRTSPINILSFGCSIGDELATLRVHFPNATIHGCDIDPFALDVAQRSVGKLAHVFVSSEEEIIRRGPYDLVCAFSSLCIHPLPVLPVFQRDFPFSRFEQMVELLSAQMRPGAIFAVKNSSYPFNLTRVARDFNTIRTNSIQQNGFIPVFNPNGKPALSAKNTEGGAIFKVEDVEGMQDWDFIDCVFQKRESSSAPREVIEHPMPPYIRPEMPFEALAQWERSNLDFLKDDAKEGLIEIKQSYQTFRSPERPDAVFVERAIVRRSINGTDMISFGGARGWWA